MSISAFYDAVRPLFGGKLKQSQVDGLAVLLDATAKQPLFYRAYLLATAQWETAHTMQPLRETLASTDASAVARLENAWRKGQLKAVKTPYWRVDADGKAWFGRGYVQLTHKVNYQKASALTGVDLVADPSKAMVPAIAAKILVDGSVNGMFTKYRLADFLDGKTPDYVGARRVINGTNKAAEIAKLARTYEAALRKLGDAAPVIDAEPAPKPPDAGDVVEVIAAAGFLTSQGWALLERVWGKTAVVWNRDQAVKAVTEAEAVKNDALSQALDRAIRGA